MGQVTAEIKLTSASTTTDSLSVNVVNNLDVLVGGTMTQSINATTTGAADTILLNTDYETPAYVYLRNMNSLLDNYISINVGAEDAAIILKSYEWAWFPWNTTGDIKAYGSQADLILEFGCFS